MMKLSAWLLAGLLLLGGGMAQASELDQALDRVIRARGLAPLETPAFAVTPKYRLGQMLFFDPVLSGNRDVSCATCHLVGRGTSDATPLSIGVGGAGLAEKRKFVGREDLHNRNTNDIWNRSHPSVRNMFWDGRVKVDATIRKGFRSPLRDDLPEGMESALAVQALFPIAGEEEMLGYPGDSSAADLPAPHANQPNELAEAAIGLIDNKRIVAVHDALRARLFGRAGTPIADWQIAYRRLITAAFPDKPLGAIRIGDLANAIGHFEAIAFATRDTPWDKYLAGEKGAISDDAKSGALLFYGKARCAACHKGALFSDFQFHSLAVPQIGPGIDDTKDDRGRFRVTKIKRHLYRFRTPPLRNVTLTAPYFHDGVVATLEQAIAHHLELPRIAREALAVEASDTGAAVLDVARARTISPILARGIDLSAGERADLVAFLAGLEDAQIHMRDLVVPDSVPSGLPVHAILE